MKRLLAATLALSIVLPAAPGALAQDDASKKEAQEHFAKGVEFFNDGEYGAALAEFHWAYEVAPHFMVLYNIARCYARLNKHIEAKKYFDQYLAEGGDKIPEKRLAEVKAEMDALVKIIAYLDITTGDVKGATIQVGDKVAGLTPLPDKYAVEPGPITVSASADGYKPESKEIVVAAGKQMKVEFKLIWIEKWGEIEIQSDAPKSVVYVDGKEMGKAPWKGKLKAGTHTVDIKAPGYKKATQDVLIEDADDRVITLKPVIEGEPARLVIEANVDGAEVFIEGNKVGTTPIKPLDLPPGPNHVTIKADGYITFEGDIQLTSGKPTKATIKLIQEGAGVHPAAFWTTAGLAVAAAIGGTVTGVLTLQKQDEYDAFLKDVTAGTEPCGTLTACTKKKKDIAEAGKTLQTVTDAMWGVTAGAGIAAITLAFFTRFKPPESKVELSATPVLAPDYAGVALGGNF